MKTLITLLIITFSVNTMACEFEGLTLSSYWDYFEIQEVKSDDTNSWNLFSNGFEEIGKFEKESCLGYLSTENFYSVETNKSYTVVYTNDDNCDGGNSYGVVYRDNELVATIQDYDFYCQEKPEISVEDRIATLYKKRFK